MDGNTAVNINMNNVGMNETDSTPDGIAGNGSSSLSDGAIGGISAASILLAVIVVSSVIFFTSRNRPTNDDQDYGFSKGSEEDQLGDTNKTRDVEEGGGAGGRKNNTQTRSSATLDSSSVGPLYVVPPDTAVAPPSVAKTAPPVVPASRISKTAAQALMEGGEADEKSSSPDDDPPESVIDSPSNDNNNAKQQSQDRRESIKSLSKASSIRSGASSLDTAESLELQVELPVSLDELNPEAIESNLIEVPNLEIEDVPPSQSSRIELDIAIEAEDWAAVGATAALLAAASDSQSLSSRSYYTDRSQTNTSVSSCDASRAAELDDLVDAGDWEGVVMAAAKFQAADLESGAKSPNRKDTSTASTALDSTTSISSGSPNHSNDDADDEDDDDDDDHIIAIREKVVELVRRAVPEEIDNVDEMMSQFKGREEELLATLETMQH